MKTTEQSRINDRSINLARQHDENKVGPRQKLREKNVGKLIWKKKSPVVPKIKSDIDIQRTMSSGLDQRRSIFRI